MLYRQGLLTHDTARIHRLVQDVTLAHLPETDRHQRVMEAVELLAELFPHPGTDPEGWPQSAQLLVHAQAVLAHAREIRLISPAMSRLLRRTGGYLRGRKLDVRLARELHELALAMDQRLYDNDHPAVADSLINLGLDLSDLREFERARELDEQALAMYQRLHDGDHPDIASSLNNLASDLSWLGEHEKARELREQALAMNQRLEKR